MTLKTQIRVFVTCFTGGATISLARAGHYLDAALCLAAFCVFWLSVAVVELKAADGRRRDTERNRVRRSFPPREEGGRDDRVRRRRGQ